MSTAFSLSSGSGVSVVESPGQSLLGTGSLLLDSLHFALKGSKRIHCFLGIRPTEERWNLLDLVKIAPGDTGRVPLEDAEAVLANGHLLAGRAGANKIRTFTRHMDLVYLAA